MHEADEVIRQHIEFLAMDGKRPNTIYYRRLALARLADALAPVPLADATEADLIAWRAGLSHLADASIIVGVGHARGFYRWLARTGYRPDNPAEYVPVPRKPEYEPRPISEDDLAAAIAAAEGRTRIWLVLIACAGMRPCEICALRRNCIRDRDLQPGIRILPGATKGSRRGRFVPLPGGGFVLAELAAADLPASGWCWPRLDGKPGHVGAHVVSHEVCGLLHSLGIADTAYAGRHRFATRVLRASGGNIRLVKDALGHADISTTSVYTEVENSEVAAAVAAIPDPAPRRLRAAS